MNELRLIVALSAIMLGIIGAVIGFHVGGYLGAKSVRREPMAAPSDPLAQMFFGSADTTIAAIEAISAAATGAAWGTGIGGIGGAVLGALLGLGNAPPDSSIIFLSGPEPPPEPGPAERKNEPPPDHQKKETPEDGPPGA